VGLISRVCLACVTDPLIWVSPPVECEEPTNDQCLQEKSLKEMSKTQRFDEGIFVKFGPKNSRGCISDSSDGAIGQKGVNYKFLQLSGMQLKQSKHLYHDCKLV
jgi:hypothetical protein